VQSTLPQYFVIRGAVVPPGDTAQLDFPLTLPAGAVLAANASTATVQISAFGLEVS
jgi:hypothetical protein